MNKAHDQKRPLPARRLVLGAIAALGGLFALASTTHSAYAEPPTAPFPVQAEIVTRILPYDRGFSAKARGKVSFLLLQKGGDAESASAILQMQKALSGISGVRDLPIVVETTTYAGAGALASTCTEKGINVVYLAPGLASEVDAIRGALNNSGVLTFAAVEPYVAGGAVLGVDVANGKPRISINLAQARAQGFDFPASVLKLAKVY